MASKKSPTPAPVTVPNASSVPAPAVAPAPSPVETVTADELLEGVDTPPVSEAAIAANAAESATNPVTPPPAPPVPPSNPTTIPTGELDTKGVPFDPTKHRPEKNDDGGWKSRRGRTKGQTISSVPLNSDATPTNTSGGDRFDATAELFTRSFYSISDGLFQGNGEWLPENDGEHTAFRNAVAAYLRHKNVDDLPPGMALAMAGAAYAGKRVTKPNTSMRIRMFGAWIKNKWYNWKNGRSLSALPVKEIKKEEQSPLPPKVENPPGTSPILST